MPVEMLVLYPNSDHESDVIPITSHRAFRENWLPVCSQLGLQWVPSFSEDLHVSHEPIQVVLDELSRLRTAILQSPPAQKSDYLWQTMSSNLDRLIDALRKIQLDGKEVELWFS